jgi:hypothetical protein
LDGLLSLRAASALLAAWQSASDEIASQKTLAMTSIIGLSELEGDAQAVTYLEFNQEYN